MPVRRALLSATTLGAVLLLGVPAAMAQPVTGVYVGAGGGANFLQDQTVRISPFFPSGKDGFDTGAAGVGSVGYGFGNGLRVELQGGYRYNELSGFSGAGFPTTASGNEQSYGGMVNALFDLDVGADWIYPYFGAGAGYSWTNLDNVSVAGPGFAQRVGGTAGEITYQGIFGLSFPVAPVPGLSLTAEYRFTGGIGTEAFHGSSYGTEGAFGPKPLGVSRGNYDITSDYNHSLLIGLRYEFNAVPPAPAASPAPVPPPMTAATRTYLVFFDWDRADLSDRARQIVAEAAQASTHVQTTRIEVDGYTDLSGTAPYNDKLSVRRAESVQAELVRDGVPRQEIVIRGFGEANPLVPTAQGVREPQNRRVEIILH